MVPGSDGLGLSSRPGMGVPTVTATRILKGQLQGKLGPETPLAMDAFPYVALSKVPSSPSGAACHPGTAATPRLVPPGSQAWTLQQGVMHGSGLGAMGLSCWERPQDPCCLVGLGRVQRPQPRAPCPAHW